MIALMVSVTPATVAPTSAPFPAAPTPPRIILPLIVESSVAWIVAAPCCSASARWCSVENPAVHDQRRGRVPVDASVQVPVPSLAIVNGEVLPAKPPEIEALISPVPEVETAKVKRLAPAPGKCQRTSEFQNAVPACSIRPPPVVPAKLITRSVVFASAGVNQSPVVVVELKQSFRRPRWSEPPAN